MSYFQKKGLKLYQGNVICWRFKKNILNRFLSSLRSSVASRNQDFFFLSCCSLFLQCWSYSLIWGINGFVLMSRWILNIRIFEFIWIFEFFQIFFYNFGTTALNWVSMDQSWWVNKFWIFKYSNIRIFNFCLIFCLQPYMRYQWIRLDE